MRVQFDMGPGGDVLVQSALADPAEAGVFDAAVDIEQLAPVAVVGIQERPRDDAVDHHLVLVAAAEGIVGGPAFVNRGKIDKGEHRRREHQACRKAKFKGDTVSIQGNYS